MSMYVPVESQPRKTTWANSPRMSLIRAFHHPYGSSSEERDKTCKIQTRNPCWSEVIISFEKLLSEKSKCSYQTVLKTEN